MMKRSSIFIPFLLACALLAGCKQAPPAHVAESEHVRISFSTNRVAIGDIITARVEVTHPSSSAVTLSGVDRGDNLSVISRTVNTEEQSDTESVTTFDYKLQSFEIGVHTLSTNALSLRHTDSTENLSLPDLTVEVGSQLNPEDTDLAELKDPVLWARTEESRFLLALVAVLALALIAGLIAYFWLRSKKDAPAAPAIIIPAHEIALQALRTLKGEDLLTQGNVEGYFVRLSDIVRHYLENRFELHAPERTTEEFIREAAESAALNSEQKQQVQDFLTQSDLVKFARFMPSTTEADSSYDSALQLVNETTHTEQVDG